MHDPNCDVNRSPSDIVAGISKPCNCGGIVHLGPGELAIDRLDGEGYGRVIESFAHVGAGMMRAAGKSRLAADSFRKFNDALRAIDGRPPAHYNPEPMFGLRTRRYWASKRPPIEIKMTLTEWSPEFIAKRVFGDRWESKMLKQFVPIIDPPTSYVVDPDI